MNVESFSIGELCSSVSERYTENLPYVRLVNTSDILEGELLPLEKVKNENLKGQFKKAFKNGDILFSEIRPANRLFAFIENENTKELIASTKLMVIRANKDKVIPKYLYYFLTSQNILNKLQNLAETRSGTFPQITFSGEIAPISIKLPNIADQNHIVNFIDAINSKILINKKINKNLVAYLFGLLMSISPLISFVNRLSFKLFNFKFSLKLFDISLNKGSIFAFNLISLFSSLGKDNS